MELIRYFLACGGDVTLLDLDVALAVGQRDFLVSVATPAARHLRALEGITVVLDSGAWPPGNPSRPPFEAWWQEVRRWREGRDDYGNLAYAIAYDTIGDAHATARNYRSTIGRIFSRAPDAPIVPVLGFGQAPEAVSIAITQGWEGVRPDLVDGGGLFVRPAYALGGLVPQRGSAEAVAWVQGVGQMLASLVADGWAEEALGVHMLGSTRRAYLGAFAEAASRSTVTPRPRSARRWRARRRSRGAIQRPSGCPGISLAVRAVRVLLSGSAGSGHDSGSPGRRLTRIGWRNCRTTRPWSSHSSTRCWRPKTFSRCPGQLTSAGRAGLARRHSCHAPAHARKR